MVVVLVVASISKVLVAGLVTQAMAVALGQYVDPVARLCLEVAVQV